MNNTVYLLIDETTGQPLTESGSVSANRNQIIGRYAKKSDDRTIVTITPATLKRIIAASQPTRHPGHKSQLHRDFCALRDGRA